MVQLLLKNGADITLVNDDGQTAVELAKPKLQKLLLDNVARGGDKMMLLQAAWMGDISTVEKLLVWKICYESLWLLIYNKRLF